VPDKPYHESELSKALRKNDSLQRRVGIVKMADTLSTELLNYKEPLSPTDVHKIIIRIRNRLLENDNEV
jgi:hypothetical protein